MNITKLNKNQQLRLITVLGVILLIFGVYLGGLIYYSSHFLPQTFINGIDVSNLNKEKADELLNEQAPVLTVIEKDTDGYEFKEWLPLKNIDSKAVYDSAYDLSVQNALKWFLSEERNISCGKVSGEPDLKKLDSFIKDLYCLKEKNIIKPQDAGVIINGTKAEIREENDGSYIPAEKVKEMIETGIKVFYAGSADNMVRLADAYDKASIHADDPSLPAKKEAVEKLLNKKITLTANKDGDLELSGEKLCELLTTENSEAIVNEDKMEDFIFEVSKNNSHTIDRPALKNELSEALLKEGDSSIELKKKTTVEALADVSIKEQTLWYYENDTLILRTPVVSGKPGTDSETPQGEYQIRRKKEKATLVSSTYLEHVDYWIGWDQTGRVYGFHDAQWRNDFGNEIYLEDPSHGCVNLPLDKVAKLYELADIGTKVVIRE